MSDHSLWLNPSWREPVGGAYLAEHFALSYVEVLKGMSDMSAPISSILTLGELDTSVIWRWNKTLPPATEVCIQDLILEQVQKHPGKQAICSWDGNLSYEELDSHSTLLAKHLVAIGLLVGDIIPLCFEKSKWTTVAVLAVMKAGGAFVLMDPSQPLQRRQTMAEQVNARFILTSESIGPLGLAIAPEAKQVIVANSLISSLTESGLSYINLPFVSPDSILYIIFTSGSTGKPKGVIISHTTYTTSALTRSTDIGYTDVSRVLDFTSYAFDVSIDSMLSTLLRGGCLCIPSDEDRMNDLSGAMRRAEVNVANMTPSVARILDPDIIPSLNSLGIGGEACSAGDISIWGQHTRVVVGYGPAECTIGCTVNPSAAGKPYVSMGSAKGCTIWLVHPDDHDKLVPVGAIGELLIEGPIVGQGYLGDPEKTEAAFIRDPQFLLAGGAGVPGRRGRLYKTGDLVRYDPDGENGFIFVGRKDSQVKLRGQRVELGEIEHHIKKLLPAEADVVAEVIAPEGQTKESMLVAFVADRNYAKTANGDLGQPHVTELSPELQDTIATANTKLAEILPIYMVPSTYIGMTQIPMLVSGKIDRKSLRALGSTISLQTLSSNATAENDNNAPTTDTECCLQAVWSQLLGLPEDQIFTNRNFFILGGDSIMAMKLVPALRARGFELTVAEVFSFPVLSDMAKTMKKMESDGAFMLDVPAFSLLNSSWDRDQVLQEAADHCNIDVSSIQDIYPCAPMQEIHMAFYTRSKENYVAQRIAEIPDKDSADKLKTAWDTVIRECAILRTRIVEFKEYGFLQVVTNEPPQWQFGDSLDGFLAEDKKTPMLVNSPLSRFGMVHDVAADKHYFVWTAHHAVYDGWSTDLLVDHVKNVYNGQIVQRSAEFKHFIKFLVGPERDSSKSYWLTQLDGANGPQFPALPSRSYIPEPTSLAERFISVDKPSKNDITNSTIFRAAWALVASQYTMNDDIVFGETFTGRTLPVPGIEEIEGPILATIPVRVRVDRTASIYEFLQSIQEQGVTRSAHEHFGIQNIRRLSPDAQIACEVSMGMVIQPSPQDVANGTGEYVPEFVAGDVALEALHFNTYPVMFACVLQGTGFRVVASFDSKLVSEAQMQRVLQQLERAVYELCRDTSRCVNDISCVSREELTEIWKANSQPPVTLSEITARVSRGDSYPAVKHVPWVVNSGNSNLLMPIGTIGELLLEGVGAEANLDAPEWLIKGADGIHGRGGKLYLTGDLVKYSDDLNLIFVGKKNDLKQVNGHVIDLELVDRELKRLLPENAVASSRLVFPQDSTTPIVVAFVKERVPASEKNMINLGMDINSTVFPFASILSANLVKSILGLKKAMLEAMPPYMIPTVFIPVATGQHSGDQIGNTTLDELTQHITLPLVSQIRQCFGGIQSSVLEPTRLTETESILRSLWAKFLSVEEASLTLDDNFFRLGGDSILAMRIVSALRQGGYALSVADTFRYMKLRDMANAISKIPTSPERQVKPYSPYSLLGDLANGKPLFSLVSQNLADSNWIIEDAMPVTDPQSRDVRATVSRPRSAVQYSMLHMNGQLDVPRLTESFQHLVNLHAILRTVFIEHNDGILQVVLKNLQIPVSEHICPDGDTLEQYARYLATEDIDIDDSFCFGNSFAHLFIITQNDRHSLMLRMSHAQYDGVSLPELLQQLDTHYRGMDIPVTAPFSSYLHHTSSSRSDNIKYWQKRLQGSSLVDIVSPADPKTSTTCFFTKPVDVSARPSDITLATLLTAGWAKVLASALSTSDVTFAGIVSGRSMDIDGVEHIMGPCYQYMPMRVKFEAGWTVKILLEHVRDQYLEGSAHATLGFEEIRKECADWEPTSRFYSSFVNHLDKGYFDTMPFGNGECRVDYLQPHPEPSTPPRVISFVEAGKTFVGIEADEERREFWEARLEELAHAVELFAKDPLVLAL